MIYNTYWRVGKEITPPTQEEIYTMPEYFALSRDEIYAHSGCPDFLKRLLDQFPWDGRPNVLQIRPQDFRSKTPDLLGSGFHTDIMVRLNDGNVRVAKNSYEFHLMVCSWGNVTETEFLRNPMEMPGLLEDPSFSPMDLYHTVGRTKLDIFKAMPNTLVEYTSRDIHRMSPQIRYGKLRLMIVAFDTDSVCAGGYVLPSIKDKELNPNVGPQFKDYVR